MTDESENQRVDRLRDAQIAARDRGTKQSRSNNKPGNKPGSKSASKAPARKPAVAVQPKKKAVKVDRENTTANALHDIFVGAGISAIPAVLALLFLPGGFKLLAIVVVLAGAAVGYLKGETLA